MARRFHWSFIVLAFAALRCGGAVRPGTDAGPGAVCSPEGARAPSSDGCNECVCTHGAWACTEKACPTQCTPGATREAGDGCNTCSCTGSGEWACTLRACQQPTQCGGLGGSNCMSSEYCAYEPGQLCGLLDASATCRPRPQACDQRFAPVCGCNQKTYDNACSAAMDGTGVLTTGACSAPPPCVDGQMKSDACNSCICTGGAWACTDRACPTPQCKSGETKPAGDGCNICSCTELGQWACTLRACAIDAGAARFCGARAGSTCATDEYCAYQAGEYCGAADAESTCKPRPGACTLQYAPVCGCDQKTYGNACAAAQAGTGVYSDGACRE